MTHHLRHTLLLLATFLLALSAAAQSGNIRYVKTSGDNSKDGTSWANAKKDIQEAINDLAGNNLTGEVWVAAGTYYPTETTESTTSLYYKAFKIPAGITVRGGFAGTESNAIDRAKQADNHFGDGTASGNLDGEPAKSGVYVNQTILCGDLTPSKKAKLDWNDQKQQFDPIFYGNSYHVVWFAMNGFDANGRALPLAKPAKLEGCIVEGGHANTRDVLTTHPHIGYGGGIYMVLNSFVYNCEVRNCDASRNGGGIYMDGGGIVRRTYVHDCQALGLGTDYGYGGGICQNGGALTAKERPCVVAQSVVTNCVGRMGGGIATMADQTNSSGKYAVVSNSTLVNNCTATIEGGGVYTYKGGGVASLTIVRNKCNGSGITQGGILTGRSGGLYSYDAAYVANTVMWGNKCEANNDVQFASARGSLADSEKSKFYHNAVTQSDNTDWSNTIRMGVVALDNENSATGAKGNLGYPLFFNPTTSAGYLATATTDGSIDWTVSSESALTFAGVATIDLDTEGLTPAPEHSWDMQLGKFNSRPTIGAFISQKGSIEPATNITYNSTTYNYAIFVDPDFVYAADNTGTNGATWEHPVRFLGNALDYVEAHKTDYAGKKVAIFVKEGTVDNTRDAGADRIRITSLDIPSNVSVFGSFDSDLTGTDLTLQNVVHTPTIISARLMDQYNYNVAHLINIEGKNNIHLEGFKLSFANASSTDLSNTNKDGAAITLTNSSNITFRNIIVSNCTADRGAAVYADHTTATHFENCIFHNNESKVLAESGIIYATNGSALTFDHCDVLRNVGHASYLGTNGTTNRWTNSIFYGNMDRKLADTNLDMGGGIEKALEAFSGTTANATGDHCMFDSKSASFSTQFGGNDTSNKWQYNLQYAFIDGTGQGYPRFINPTKNAGVTVDGDQTYYGRATSFEPHNNNPIVNMASHDGAHTTWGTDIIDITRDFGGLPDIGAVENHEATDGVNAYKDGQKKYGEGFFVRDYTPATGTQMDTYDYDSETGTYVLNAEGKGIYKKSTSGDVYELLDGSSWEYAVNGNGIYTLSGSHTYKDVTDKAVMGFRFHEGNWYLSVIGGNLYRIDCTPGVETPDPDGAGSMLYEHSAADCTVFILCDASGKELPTGSTITTAKRLKDATTGQFLYLDYLNGVYSFKTSYNPPASQAAVTIAQPSSGVYTMSFVANKQTRYVRNNATIPSTTSTRWTFYQISDFKIKEGTGVIKTTDYDFGTFNGLQYAVNKANIAFEDDYSLTNDVQGSKKQVWVGAGVYSSDPKVTAAADYSSETDPEAENCYVIKDGVDVYGAFPKTGNPGMDQRQALVSRYVHIQTGTDGTTPLYDYNDFETILEPATKGVAVDVTRRVLGQTYDYNPKKTGYKVFASAKWDGFTLRDGVLDAHKITYPNRHGGAGAAIYYNVTLKNVVVTGNTTIYKSAGSQQDFRAGGIYSDGGTLDAGYVINNKLESYTASERTKSTGAAYGGGMYIYRGTVFNSVIARNSIYAAYADGAGTFIEQANFFNNTIVYNKAEGNNRMCGGVAIWNDAASRGTDSELNVYNCIIAKNDGAKGGKTGNANMRIQSGGVMNINYCITEDIHTPYVSGSNKITFYNCQEVTDYSAVFVTDGTIGGNFEDFNLRLNTNAANAINKGNDAPAIGGAVYNLVDYNDMDFTERIQDCRIDIGAYEFNGATGITPEETANQAIYYVTPNGYGTTNAHDPENAACAEKLQRVLDAAGRYKYLNPGKQVIVKVANSYDFLHPTNGDTPINFTYYATRTTDWTDQDVRVWSIIVPRGVEVWGGYTDIALNDDDTEYKVDSKRVWDNTYNGFVFDGADRRNITKHPTYFDSYYLNKLEKTDANTYHVVSFTDRIFDLNGYAYTKADFEGKTNEQIRTILQNGSASAYVELLDNDESHFVHLSEPLGGLPGISGNVITEGGKPKNFGTAETPKYASNRAVIDGIFVSGGKADAPANSTNITVNINSYGGAALVNDYAYVRNCILVGNTATNGGALALTDHALVSGCLIMDNEAHNEGGGIYVFEEGTKLSNGTTINSLRQPGDPTMDYNMAHVLTSTIVQNTAQRGGGVWFSNQNHESVNVRFNSVAIWQNKATEQANVYGMVNPEQPTEDETVSEEFYPFCYSAIQNIRASGTNNLIIGGINHEGMRFVDKTHDVGQATVDQTNIAEEGADGPSKYDNFGYYGLTEYSLLCSNGMPVYNYNQLKAAVAISDDDILGTDRLPSNKDIIFVEIGARALEMKMPNQQLMLRLFVADPKYVDTNTATRFMMLRSKAGATDAEKYYSQVGSSFAYPFNSLQNALDYIKQARDGLVIKNNYNSPNYDAQNLPFEILVGKGTYWPKQSLNAETQNVWAATFAIPEGVTIMGGFNPQGGGATSYYGRYYEKDTEHFNSTSEGSIYNNVKRLSTVTSQQTPSATEIGRGNYYGTESVVLPAIGGQEAKTIDFQQWHIEDIADRRAMYDNNKNGIIEPWEFSNQTIISGNAVNGETDGVYHVMTAVADADAVGLMPKVQKVNDQFVGSSIAEETGYQWKEQGQQIRLNGLIVTGGNALTYLETALDDYGSYMYYHGAGLLVDGNRYKNPATTGDTSDPEFHNSAAYGLGYRDIPVSITNCQFRNNIAGYGGAISSNGSLSIFASSFEQNKAVGQTETPEPGDHWYTNITGSKTEVTEVAYPGQGGAIHATNQLSAFNTLFANNEACLGEDEPAARVTIDLVKHPTFRVPNAANASATLRAAGGAIMMGSAAEHNIVNCNFVRNKANAYPAVFTMNPTRQQGDAVNTHDYSQIINTVAWGNEVNVISSDENYLTASRLLVNIGKKNRTVNYITTKGAGDFYDPSFTGSNVPSASDLNNDNAEASGDWQEAVWFCAYEDGVGFKQTNTNDLRDAIVYSPAKYAPTMIADANNHIYQNCNIQIVADNNDVAGPNFGNPSLRAGFDGFTEGADWSPARFNRLTDQGNGWIKQSVAPGAKDFEVTFHTGDGNGTGYQGAYPYTHFISDIIVGQFPEYKLWLAIGNEKYMQATNDQEPATVYINGTSLGTPNKNYPRISPDPTMGVTKAYIDIGVYEYQKQPLLKPGGEVDILWVSTKEHPENGAADGHTWKTPTSDLQRAIETLLSSRNGHKKEIRIMEGEYTPVTLKTIGGTKYSAFVIDTESLNGSAITPTGFNDGHNNDQYYAQSLTIKGGYSAEIMYEYDPATYKTVIRQDDVISGINTNYLLYIADPTLRYAYGTYNEVNKQGATYGSNPATESYTARTMPIQVDGVTLINDKAEADTQGSAIYYPDYPEETAPAQTITEAHSISVGGKVNYYPTKADLDAKTNAVTYETEFAEITTTGAETIQNPAKLVITKTHVVGSGSPAADDPAVASAVYIGKNGGSALIYNSVFHSNYGMPLDAWNTVNVNNTFGLNAGKVQLRDDADVTVKSQMHNSALWRNNSDGDQVTFDGVAATGGAAFSYNSYTGATVDDTYHLTPLTNVNGNIAEGPNFVDPENADIEARNFDIKPSRRLFNQGDGYRALPVSPATDDIYTGIYNTLVVGQKYDYSLAATYDRDALYRTRIVSSDTPQRIDIGAYEFLGSLYNPLYVDPNKAHSATAEGRSWDDAFGYGDIQSAMDLAAIYHLTNPTEEGYVFVKGASATNRDLHTDETLTLRDGVTVYGSIAYSYTDWHRSKEADDITPKYGNGTDNPATINAYITDMASIREGIASNAASKTRISGIRASEHDAFNTNAAFPALLDGFVVTPVSPTLQPTAPVLDVTNTSAQAVIALRNIIVADNDLSAATATNVNVAQINNGLLYEVLMRDNKPKGSGADLQVSKRGYAVNVTVEGKTVGADGTQPVDGKSTASASDNVEAATHIYSSITNSIDTGSVSSGFPAGSQSPYGSITSPDISGYFYNIGDANLNYQLTETSRYIDACATTNPLTSVAPSLAPLINYRTDRDLLGNPRLLAGVTTASGIDRGAFETWKVENAARKFQCGDDGTIDGIEPYDANTDGAYSVIKKHFYPHDGSVCYIMEGQALVIDAPDPAHEVKPTPHNPGFMLLKEGASFYGNRRPATCAYVAVERHIDREHGSIIALPYDLKYADGTTQPRYTNDRLTGLTPNVVERIYDYDASARSAWDYIFKTTDTGCWTSADATATTPANHGILVEPEASCFVGSEKATTFRFTAKGTGLTDFVYTEDGAPSRSVTLTQHDDKESTDGAADFTDKEDMGWNCIGLPYLVSDYRPYEIVRKADGKTDNGVTGDDLLGSAATTHAYRLHLPHTLWLYYDGIHTDNGTTPVNGDGGYYSADSWDAANWNVRDANDARIWVGEGIFTQTAAMADTETLTFYLPDPATIPAAASSSPRRNVRYYYGALGDVDDNDDDNDDSALAPTLLRTEYYDIAGHRIVRPDTNGVTTAYPNGIIIVREVYSDGTARTIKMR